MKGLVARCLVGFFLSGIPTFAFAGDFRSVIITSSRLVINVLDHHFLRIWNFTQEGGTERGVVTVTVNGQTANVLTAIRIDFSTGINSQNFPEIGNEVIIAGPTEVKIPPVAGATFLITYQKEANEGGEETNLIVTGSPTPAGTPAASATPSATSAPTVTPAPTSTPTPLPTSTPRPTRTPRPP